MPIPVPVSELLGTFLETLGFGIYLTILPRCIGILRAKQLGGGLLFYFLGTTFVSFLLITLHWIVDLVRTFQAYTGHLDRADAAEAFFAIVDTNLNLTKTAVYVAVTLLADAMLLYRTFIVWGRSYVVAVLPVLLFGLDISMSIWFTWSINQATPGASVLASTVFQRAKYFYAATLAMNLCCTLLIGFRIWKIQSGLNSFRGGGRVNVLSIIVESAAIYSAALICLIGTSVGGSSIMFAFLNLMPPLVGCVFAFLTIGSSSEIKKSQATSSSGPGTLPQNSMHRNRERHPQSYMGGNDASFTATPTNTQGRVVIRLDRVVQVHDDGDSAGKQPLDDGDSTGGRKEQASIV